jgi:uncharacterized membrane protein
MDDRPAYGADEEKDDLVDEVAEPEDLEPVELDEEEAPAAEPAPEPDVPADEDEYEVEMVPCPYCGEPHPEGAWRCRACHGFLPIIEGTIHREHFFFLFSSLTLFLGTLLVWEPRTWLTGADSVLGAFVLVTSGYAMFASVVNIFHRKMIVWPHLTAMIFALWAGWQRVIQLIKTAELPEMAKDASFADWKVYINECFGLFGPGLYLVVPVATIMLVFLVTSIFAAGKRDAQRKAAMRAERATERGDRRRRR